MASKYFSGSAPASYLPPGFMESATAPGRYYAEAMGSIGKAVGAGLAKRNQRKKDKAYFDFIERMGETPTSRTETVPGVEMVDRGRPLTDEASGDYFNETLERKTAYEDILDNTSRLLTDEGAYDRMKQYAEKELPANHPIHEIIAQNDQSLEDAITMTTEDVTKQWDTMVRDSITAQTQRPDPVAREGGPSLVDPFGRLARPDQQLNDMLKKTYTDSLKWTKSWRDDLKAVVANEEKKLDDFMAGKDRKGNPIQEATIVEREREIPLSLKERREIVTSDLAGMARSMGRERFKEARAEVDKLFPRQPEIGVTEQGGALVITEDGAYKAAMAKPKLQGNSMFEQLSEASQKAVPGLQDDVRKDPSIAKYIESYTALNIMKGAAGLQSGAGDLALVTKFMKALDPESVVRESEVAQAQNTIPAYRQIELLIKGLGDDEKLLDDQRDQLVAAAEKLVSKGREIAEFRINDYREKGSLMGIPDKLFIPRLPGEGSEAQGEGGQDATPKLGWDPVKLEWIPISNASN